MLNIPFRTYRINFETHDYRNVGIPPDYSKVTYVSTLEFDNISQSGKPQLRISFEFVVNATASLGLVSGAVIQPCVITMYNLSPESLAAMDGSKVVSFSAGYQHGNSPIMEQTSFKEPVTDILKRASVMKVRTYRQDVDMITQVYCFPNKVAMDRGLLPADLFKYKTRFSKEETFKDLLKKYYPDAYITGDSFKGFKHESDKGYPVLFKAGTSLHSALLKVCAGVNFAIDMAGELITFTQKTVVEDLENSGVPTIELNQGTGLLGVPFLSAGGFIEGTSLFNPDIKQGAYLHIQTQAGFVQGTKRGTSFATTVPEYKTDAIAQVMTVRHIGDSRQGKWITHFTTSQYLVPRGA